MAHAIARKSDTRTSDHSTPSTAKTGTVWKRIQNSSMAYKCAAGVFIVGIGIILLLHLIGSIDGATTGGCAAGIVAIALLILGSYHIHKRSNLITKSQEAPLPDLDYETALSCAQRSGLAPGEFFLYQCQGVRMIMLNHPQQDIGLGEYHAHNYDDFKRQYTEVSFERLRR